MVTALVFGLFVLVIAAAAAYKVRNHRGLMRRNKLEARIESLVECKNRDEVDAWMRKRDIPVVNMPRVYRTTPTYREQKPAIPVDVNDLNTGIGRHEHYIASGEIVAPTMLMVLSDSPPHNPAPVHCDPTPSYSAPSCDPSPSYDCSSSYDSGGSSFSSGCD